MKAERGNSTAKTPSWSPFWRLAWQNTWKESSGSFRNLLPPHLQAFLAWQPRLSTTLPLAFYAPEEIDFIGFKSVARHLPPMYYITQNKAVKAAVQQRCLTPKPLFSFPEVLITSRHAMHRFPSSKIISIGMRHGPYHFKRMTRAANYNRFDLYLFSSSADLAAAEEIGVKVGKAIGFPLWMPLLMAALLRMSCRH